MRSGYRSCSRAGWAGCQLGRWADIAVCVHQHLSRRRDVLLDWDWVGRETTVGVVIIVWGCIFLEGRAVNDTIVDGRASLINDTIVNHLNICGAFRFHWLQRMVRDFR
eukprot:765291-Hanusia_phi.AAC.1